MSLLDQVIRTKIVVPRRRDDLLKRTRLIELFEEMAGRKLVIVTAPAGSGKTSFLIEIAHHSKLQSCWYALEPLDRDVQRFAIHLIATIAAQFPDFGTRSLAVLQSDKFDPNQLITALVNEIYDVIPQSFQIIIDDYHLVDQSDEVNGFINRFIQLVSDNCHVIIASRTLLPLEDLPLLVVRSQTNGLSYDELAFQSTEIQALMQQNFNSTLSEPEADALVKESEGWITGLLLSSSVHQAHGMVDHIRAARISGVGLYDYLAEQVLNQQTKPIRDFLLKTSLLEEFNAQLCHDVFGPGEWATLIQTISRGNLFVFPVSDGGLWLRYHHLFRDFLQSTLTKETPDAKDIILRRLAEVYAKQEQWEKAYELYRNIDIEAAAQLLKQIGANLMRQGRRKILVEWLDDLPNYLLEQHPLLRALRGYLTFVIEQERFTREQSLFFMDEAVLYLKQTGKMAELAQALLWRAMAHDILGNYSQLLKDADEVLHLNADELTQIEALRLKGISYYYQGQLNEGMEYLQRAKNMCNQFNALEQLAIIQLELGAIYENLGNYKMAKTNYNEVLEYWQATNNLGPLAVLLNNLSVLHQFYGDYEQAVIQLEQSVRYARQTGRQSFEVVALTSLGDIYMDLDDRHTVETVYGQALTIADEISYDFMRFYLHLAQVILFRKKQNWVKVNESLKKAKELSGNSAYRQGLWAIQAGLGVGDSSSSIELLKQGIQKLEQSTYKKESAIAYLHLATSHYKNKAAEQALACLLTFFELIADMDSWHHFAVAARTNKEVLRHSQQHPKIGDQIKHLLSQTETFEQNIPLLRRHIRPLVSVAVFPPPAYVFRALGHSHVIVENHLADWRSKTARKLLFYLLSQPTGASRESIGLIFWPDSSPEQLTARFKDTMSRLRKAIGSETIVLDKDLYQLNPFLDYEYDVDLFQHRINEAKAAKSVAKQIRLYQQALNLYRGEYLIDLDEMWVLTERQRLVQLHQETALTVAELYLTLDNYEAVLQHGHRLLTYTPELEAAHRLMMQAQAGLGNRTAVLQQYHLCLNVLKEFGVTPSSQTEELFNFLIS